MRKLLNRSWRACAAVLLAVLLSGLLVACNGGKDDQRSDGAVRVTFWHSASGAAAEVLKKQIAAFNQEHQGKIWVDAIYQGSYANAMAKLANAVQFGGTPP